MQTCQTAKTSNEPFFFSFKACGKPFASGFDTPPPPPPPIPKIAQDSILRKTFLKSSVSPTYQQIWGAEYFGDYSNYLHKYFIVRPEWFLTPHPSPLTKGIVLNLSGGDYNLKRTGWTEIFTSVI